MTEVKGKLITRLEVLLNAVKALWDLYEEDAPTSDNDFRPSELDSLDMANIFPLSLDEWWHEIHAKIDELRE